MKLLFLSLFSLSAFSQVFNLTDPCTGKDLLNTSYNAYQKTVGELTVDIFNQFGIDYIGNDAGMNQIQNSPLGDESLIIIDDREMYAFGWCFSVNREIPLAYAHQILVDQSTKEITWFYGYSHYRNGKWRNMCISDPKLVRKLFPKYCH